MKKTAMKQQTDILQKLKPLKNKNARNYPFSRSSVLPRASGRGDSEGK